MSAPLLLSNDPASFGHHFHVRLNGVSLDDADREVLQTLRPVGVQITDHNFHTFAPYEQWIEDLALLLEDVRAQTGREKMIISIDHEGGRVHRTPSPITHFPSPIEYAPEAAAVGAAMAQELRSLGINLSFSPNIDVHSNPDNPVIGARSFGSVPEDVGEAGVAFAQALMDGGILPCAKHFPGHGDTSTDSHLELPTVSVDLETFRQRELLPFARLVDFGIPMVMTAHILFPTLDPAYPATLSGKIVNDILRTELGFEGVVVTDDLDMRAIRDNFDEKILASHLLSAGCDLFLFNHEPLRAVQVARELFLLLDSGRLSEELFVQSHQRIEELVEKASPNNRPHVLEEGLVKKHEMLAQSLMKDQQ